MTPIIAAALGYILGMPILLRLMCVAHSQVFIKRKMAKMPKTRNAQANLPKPLWPKIKERVRFAMKDDRPFSLNPKKPKESGTPTKTVIKIVWALGAVAMVGAVVTQKYALIGLAPVFFFAAMTMCITTASPVLKERANMYRKMFEIGRATLGLSSDYAEQPQAVIQVLEWRSILSPSMVKFEVPTTFNADSEENFQRQFNQVFGTETTWVPFNDPESGKPGWNYADGEVTLKETPPLPTMAPWNERYVLDPSVAWSFFPIGLGVENGLEMANAESGETENVLGFDVSGLQVDKAKEMGVKVGGEITTSPMALCLAGDTLIAMADGSYESIEMLAKANEAGEENRLVLTMNSTGDLVPGLLAEARLTRKNAEIVSVRFTSNEELRCTPDHRIRLADGSYIRADRLRADSELAPIEGEALRVKKVIAIERADTYDGAVPGVENFIVGFPNSDRRVVVHNCAGGTGGGKALAVDTLVSLVARD